MTAPYRIGLTGGIGSGQSTVSALFRKLGVPVIDADVIVRKLVEPGEPAYEQVVALAGAEAVAPDGRLRRDLLRQAVFEDQALRAQLEAVLHPLVYREMEKAVSKITYPYCILSIPLLVETAGGARVDRVLVVDAPEEAQIARTSERDGVAADQIRRIISAQAGRRRRLQAADDVIDNSGDRETLKRRVRELHRKYLAIAAGSAGKKVN
jgi:dephospho-CoA kinase